MTTTAIQFDQSAVSLLLGHYPADDDTGDLIHGPAGRACSKWHLCRPHGWHGSWRAKR